LVLEFLQGRNPDWVGQFLSSPPTILRLMWLDDLEPAFGAKDFFYEKEYDKLTKVNKLPEHTIPQSDKQSA
jgi:hypothetical protein